MNGQEHYRYHDHHRLLLHGPQQQHFFLFPYRRHLQHIGLMKTNNFQEQQSKDEII